MSASTEGQSNALNTAPPTYDIVTSPQTKYQVTILDEHSRSGIFSKMGSYTDTDTGSGTGSGRIASASHLYSRDGSDPHKPDQYIQLTKVSDVRPVEVKVVEETQPPNEDQPTDSDRRSHRIIRGSKNRIDVVIPFNLHPASDIMNADGEGEGDRSRGSSIFDSFTLTGFTSSIKDVQELDEWKDLTLSQIIIWPIVKWSLWYWGI